VNDLPQHFLLFLLVGVVIVAIACLFREQEDRAALAIFPRRLLFFVFGCGLVAAVMLACEQLFA
jgi:hypothetical protein